MRPPRIGHHPAMPRARRSVVLDAAHQHLDAEQPLEAGRRRLRGSRRSPRRAATVARDAPASRRAAARARAAPRRALPVRRRGALRSPRRAGPRSPGRIGRAGSTARADARTATRRRSCGSVSRVMRPAVSIVPRRLLTVVRLSLSSSAISAGLRTVPTRKGAEHLDLGVGDVGQVLGRAGGTQQPAAQRRDEPAEPADVEPIRRRAHGRPGGVSEARSLSVRGGTRRRACRSRRSPAVPRAGMTSWMSANPSGARSWASSMTRSGPSCRSCPDSASRGGTPVLLVRRERILDASARWRGGRRAFARRGSPGTPRSSRSGTCACAASPSRVVRPKVQRGSGSRSTIGYSRIPSAAAMTPGTSSQSNRQSAEQVDDRGGVDGVVPVGRLGMPSGARRSAMKFTRSGPAPRPEPRADRRRTSARRRPP